MAFFHNLAHVCGKADGILMKILSQMYFWTRKSHSNVAVIRSWSLDPDSKYRLGSGRDLPWRWSLLCECCCYHYYHTFCYYL